MTNPKKHHFNPAFSLKPWAGADSLVCEMRRINGTVGVKRVHPNATGFEKNLYRTEGVPTEQEQHLEEKVMKPLDTAASDALEKILSGDATPWTGEERKAWTLYILSLMFRGPDVVQALKTHMAEMWAEGIKTLELNYAKQRRPDDPETFAEFYSKTDPAAAQISASNLLTEIIHNQRVGPDIMKMHWARIVLTRSRVPLLNSDRPLDRPLGLGDPRAYIAMPVSPTTIFLASNDATLAGRVGGGDHTKAAKLLNLTVVSRAREFVWGNDDQQLEFVRAHFGSAPVSPVISEEQRQQALAAARGELPAA